MLALSENQIIALNAIESRWPWLLLVEIQVKDDADTYRRWVQHGADFVTMLATYGGSGCVGHWKLNDNDWSTVVADSSGNGNHGAAQRKTVHLHTNGRINGAFEQNGTTDYVATAVSPTSTGSISCWFMLDVVQTGKMLMGTQDVVRCYLAIDLARKVGGGIGTESYSIIKGGPVLSRKVWYHGVITWDGSDVALYLNGSEIYSGTQSGSVPADPWFIGAHNQFGGPTRHFDGGMDNVMVFDKVLTAAEISALYNSGSGTELVPATFEAFNFTLNQILYKGGEVPKTTLRFSNVTQFLKADLAANDGLTGSEIVLRMVHANMIYEDYSELDVTFDIIFPKITAAYVEFVIGGPSPLRRRVPIEIYFADACRYVDGFKTDPRCGYDGAETTCSGLRNRCRELDNEIQFGGFPGLRPETMKLA